MMLDSGRVVQRMQEQTPTILGPQEGSFKMKFWLSPVTASTTAGSPTLDAIETFLGYMLGNSTGVAEKNATLSAAASTTAASASTTTSDQHGGIGDVHRRVNGASRREG
jgi:hypothetical protein